MLWCGVGSLLFLIAITWGFLLFSTLHSSLISSSSSTPSSSSSSSSYISSHPLHLRHSQSNTPVFSLSTHSSPPSLDEVRRNLTFYLTQLHKRFGSHISSGQVEGPVIWKEYFEITKDTLIKWDDDNQLRHYPKRNDRSIFVSVGTYRDPYCPMTLKSIYSQASNPSKIFVGLLQQNCFDKVCISGVLEGGVTTTQGTDVDCYAEFCKSPEGQRSQACENGQIRLFNINESESLGPYMARYFTSKFYQGEEYYLQIDSHSEFTRGWDDKLTHMLSISQAQNPVISTYPPDSQTNWKDSPGYRICDSAFAPEPIEDQIVRLSPSSPYKLQSRPPYSPFVAAGFLFTSGDVVYKVPFDPLLPWIFMGEEISMSSRLWTSGYDLFAPTINVLNHYYVRRHYPKYWESVNRYFKSPIHNDLVAIVINRVKYMLNYPEVLGHVRHQPPQSLSTSPTDVIDLSSPSFIDFTVTYRLCDWSMGRERSLDEYLRMVGIDPTNKVVRVNLWCHNGEWPPEASKYRIEDSPSRGNSA